MRSFIWTWAFWLAAIIAAVSTFNVIVDPYLFFGTDRVKGFNTRKPAAINQEQLLKAYDVLRERPDALLLGSSRIDLGLEAQHPAWVSLGHVAYNLGLIGGSPYMARRHLQHVMSQGNVKVVVLGLDFEYFLTGAEPDRPADRGFELRLSTREDGGINEHRDRQRMHDILHSVFSFAALSDSLRTLLSNLRNGSFEVARGDMDADLEHATDLIGPYGLFALNDLYVFRQYSGRGRDEQALENVHSIVDLCKSRGTHVILVINPMHADMLEMFYLLGYWPAIEEWKRNIVSIASENRRNDDDGRVVVWDFTGYDRYSTESVSVNSQHLHWFWESFHYTRSLGDVITRRITGDDSESFGVKLTSENIESHLSKIRDQQRLFRERQPRDVERVLRVCGWAARESLRGDLNCNLGDGREFHPPKEATSLLRYLKAQGVP